MCQWWPGSPKFPDLCRPRLVARRDPRLLSSRALENVELTSGAWDWPHSMRQTPLFLHRFHGDLQARLGWDMQPREGPLAQWPGGKGTLEKSFLSGGACPPSEAHRVSGGRKPQASGHSQHPRPSPLLRNPSSPAGIGCPQTVNSVGHQDLSGGSCALPNLGARHWSGHGAGGI